MESGSFVYIRAFQRKFRIFCVSQTFGDTHSEPYWMLLKDIFKRKILSVNVKYKQCSNDASHAIMGQTQIALAFI